VPDRFIDPAFFYEVDSRLDRYVHRPADVIVTVIIQLDTVSEDNDRFLNAFKKNLI